jgi:hypothetical protein
VLRSLVRSTLLPWSRSAHRHHLYSSCAYVIPVLFRARVAGTDSHTQDQLVLDAMSRTAHESARPFAPCIEPPRGAMPCLSGSRGVARVWVDLPVAVPLLWPLQRENVS